MDLYPTPDNPLPPGAECLPVHTRDGLTLRAMVAVPAHARGTVVVIGGRGDFIERYFETMHELMARGFAVAALDVRGQGGAQRLSRNPYRGHIRSFRAFDEDMRAFMETVVVPRCPAPRYAIGHSTGGHILLRVIRNRGWFNKVVLVSPLVGIRYGPWPRPLAALLVNAATLLGLGWAFLPGQMKKPMGREHFRGNPLTSDAKRWSRDSGTLEVAPQLGLGGPTYSWLRAARRSLASVARMGRPLCPTLIVASGADRVVDNDATRRLARKVPGIALTFIPGAAHEILTERDDIRRQFFAAFDEFVTHAPEA
ncbi:MAG TPA: alpha/beta hydrolase [Aestuariivirga sp.]|nr:alpha/beta hydrolase [Aestuariivirga sp.]